MRHKKKKHPSKEAPVEAKTETPPANAEAAVVKKDSVVDAVFDTVTAWAVQGLKGAQRGLHVSARWLDRRARAVGKLADKMERPPTSAPAVAEQAAA